MRSNGPSKKMMTIIVLVVVVGVTGFAAAISAAHNVPAGHQGVIYNWKDGTQTYTLDEGFHWITPFMDDAIDYDIRLISRPFISVESADKDEQTIKVNATVYYRLDPDDLWIIHKTVGQEKIDGIVETAFERSIKTVTERRSIQENLAHRDIVGNETTALMAPTLALSHINLSYVDVTDIVPSNEWVNANEKKKIAEQEALREEWVTKKVREQANQTVAREEGKARAKRVSADADQYAIIARAEGEAEAIRLVNTELANSTAYLQLQQIKQWDGAVARIQAGDGGGFGLLLNTSLPQER